MDNKTKLEQFETITRWLNHVINKYKHEPDFCSTTLKIQTCLESEQDFICYVADYFGIPKQYTGLLTMSNPHMQIMPLHLLESNHLIPEEKVCELIQFLDFYNEEQHNKIRKRLRHFESVFYIFKNYPIFDKARQEYILKLFHDPKFYYKNVYVEENLPEKLQNQLLVYLTKKELLNYVYIFKDTAFKDHMNIIDTISHYALDYPKIETTEDVTLSDQFGYVDTDSIRKECEEE